MVHRGFVLVERESAVFGLPDYLRHYPQYPLDTFHHPFNFSDRTGIQSILLTNILSVSLSR
jgi:hypothetical protein